jgi:hypothetical protein
MFQFLKLARKNLTKAFVMIFFIFGVILLAIAIALLVFKEDFPDLTWDDLIRGLTLNFGITLLIMVLAFFSEYREYAAFRSAMAKNPFNEMSKLGFREITLFNQPFPWKLHKPVMLATAGGFLIVAETKTRNSITFAYLAWNVNRVNFTKAIENHRDIQLRSADYGVTMTIPVDSYYTPSIDGLRKLLTGVIPFIQQQGYTPMDNLKVFEKVLKREMLQQGLAGS